MEQNTQTGGIALLAKIASEFRQFDESVVYARLSSEIPVSSFDLSPKMIKVEGSIFFLLAKGKIKLTYNFEDYEVEAPATMSFPHGSMLSIENAGTEPGEAYLLSYTPAFLQEVNISFAAIRGDELLDRKTPFLNINERELALLLRYFSLIDNVLSDESNPQLTRHIVSSLTSAMFYQLLLMVYKRIDATRTEGESNSRRSNYVHDFIKLVHIYYTKERSVNFYASKLFISPKYLSLLVKEATGRSAARWIDHFVIMEAKNLLRYSGKNIQQVAYALNFSNQSSFGKYFKHLTGMSPTDYQKS